MKFVLTKTAKEGEELGLTVEEIAFYDALTKPEAIKDFYDNKELVAITKEFAEMLRKNRTIDWQKKETARASMRKMIKRLLRSHRYPPEGLESAIAIVMRQCEMWTDNAELESYIMNQIVKLNVLLMIKKDMMHRYSSIQCQLLVNFIINLRTKIIINLLNI